MVDNIEDNSPTHSRPALTGTINPLPFDSLSPRDFERLCLWLVTRERYERAESLGAAGAEQGRDIVAWRDGKLWAFQCKRVRKFHPKDALKEVEKVLSLPEQQRPTWLVFLVTCGVTERTRQETRRRAGAIQCEFWAAAELDERVKRYPDILREFFEAGMIHEKTRPDLVANLLDACRVQVNSALRDAQPKFRSHLYIHRSIERELDEFFQASLCDPTPNCFLIVAPAGSGKTSLLCELARVRVSQQPVLLLMGSSLDPESKTGILDAVRIELESASSQIALGSPEKTLQALDDAARKLDRDALLFLDAINEHERPTVMSNWLRDLVRMTLGKRIKLVITCRDFSWGLYKESFWERAAFNNWPIDVDDEETSAGRFSRFTADEQALALPRYLASYNIRGGPVGNAAEKCRHPLLLHFFCEAYCGQDVGPVPDIRLKELFETYWQRKLQSIVERRFQSGDVRHKDVLAEEVEVYLMTVAKHMLRHGVRSIPLGELPKVIGQDERYGDPRSLSFRIQDEFIIKVEKKRCGSRSRVRRLAFVYEEFMEYVMARSLMQEWDLADRDDAAILAEISELIDQYSESFALILGVIVYLALMLREDRGMSLWALLLNRGESWQKVMFEAFRKLSEEQLDSGVFDALMEMLTGSDESIQKHALDVLKLTRMGRRASPLIVQTICGLATHEEESVRRRAVLALGATSERNLVLPLLIKSLRDPSESVQANAISALSRLGEATIEPLARTLGDEDPFVRRGVLRTLIVMRQLIRRPPTEVIIRLLDDDSSMVRLAAIEAAGELGDARAADKLMAILTGADQQAEPAPSKRDECSIQFFTWQDLLRRWQLAIPDSQRIEKAEAIVERHLVIEASPDTGHYEVSQKAVHVKSDTAECECQDFVYRQQKEGRACKHLVALAKHLAGKYQRVDTSRGDWRVPSTAAVALGKLGARLENLALRTRLTECLRDSLAAQDELVRLAVAEALVLVDDAQGLEILVAALGSEIEEIKSRAACAFHSLGPKAVAPLVNALGHHSEQVRQEAAEVLGEIGDVGAIEPLIATLNDHSNKVRDTAAKALEKFERRAVDPLILILREGPGYAKWRAAIALGNLGDWRAVEPLTAALRDTGARVRRDSAIALRKLGVDPAALLGALLADDDENVRLDATHTLGRLGDPKAVKRLIAVLNNDKERGRVRACAAEGLGKLGDGQAVDPLVVALRNKDQYVRSASAEALGRLGDVSAVWPLIDALEDPAQSVQAHAALALGRLHAEEAVDPLIDALEWAEVWVQHCAVQALRLIGTPEAIDEVEAYLDIPDEYEEDE